MRKQCNVSNKFLEKKTIFIKLLYFSTPSGTNTPKVRPLAQTAYKSAQNDTSVVAGVNAPQKSSGIMNKAMDLFFGW